MTKVLQVTRHYLSAIGVGFRHRDMLDRLVSVKCLMSSARASHVLDTVFLQTFNRGYPYPRDLTRNRRIWNSVPRGVAVAGRYSRWRWASTRLVRCEKNPRNHSPGHLELVMAGGILGPWNPRIRSTARGGKTKTSLHEEGGPAVLRIWRREAGDWLAGCSYWRGRACDEQECGWCGLEVWRGGGGSCSCTDRPGWGRIWARVRVAGRPGQVTGPSQPTRTGLGYYVIRDSALNTTSMSGHGLPTN